MDLKFISIPMEDSSKKLIDSIKALQEGTIEGLSEGNHASAYLEREKDVEIVVLRGPIKQYNKDALGVNLREGFSVRKATNRYVAFNFAGTNYKVYFSTRR